VHVRVDGNLLAGAEAGDAFADLVDHSHQLVTGNQGEDRVEVALVDVQVGAADPDLLHLDAHLAGGHVRHRDVLDGVLARGVVDDGLHGGSLLAEDDQG
jgi:hypothetical protein